MKKKAYTVPDIHICRTHTQMLICKSVTSVSNEVGLHYEGGGSVEARVKGESSYNVWNDDWNEESK